MKPQEHKYPWLAVTLSLLLPGLGQIYARALVHGIAIMAAMASLKCCAAYSLLSPDAGLGAFFVYALFALGVWLFGLVDAFLAARGRNRDLGLARLSGKDPWLTVFLTVIIPGLGHLYCRKVLKAILVFVIWGLLELPMYISLWFFPLLPVYTVLAAAHAHSCAPDSRARRRGMKLFIVAALILLTIPAAAFSIGYSIIPPDMVEELKLRFISAGIKIW